METSQPPASPPNNNRTIIWIVGGIVALCLCAALGVVAIAGGLIIFNSSTISSGGFPIPGQPTPVEESEDVGFTMDIPDGGTDHVNVGTPVDYTSNPPSSGPHYGQWIEAGFYDTTVEDGYLVHNLEHGYVIIWYNCENLSTSNCRTLENDIENLVDDLEYKVIGMNRTGNMDHVLALTSWGKLAYLDEFDESFIRIFYSDNLENSPEPEAP